MMLQAQRRWLVYKCTTGPACAQLFFTGRSLKRHQTLHHHHTPEWRNTFCCSLCDEEFEVFSSLQAHAVRQHYEAGELGSDLEPGLEPCDTGSQRQAGACVQTRRTSKSVVSPSNDGNLAECNLKSARSKSAKTAKSTVKFAVHSLAESEWRSAKSMQQSTTKCGVSIAKSAHSITRCAPSTTNTALSSTQSAQHSESSTELGAVLSVTQNVVTITGSKTPLVPTEYRPNTPQLKAAWKPLTDGSASGNLTVKSPTMTTVKTGEMVQTNGDCSARSAAQVQQQHSRGIAVDARVQPLGNATRRTTKDVTHRPTETEKLKAKAPVSQKKKYKTGRIRAFKGERVVSSSIAVSSVKQLESCDGRGLLICQVCGQVFVSAARIREHLTEHPKCSRCLEHFSHETDVAEHLCILKENSPKAGDITDDSMMHIDEEVTAVEPHNQDKSVSSNYASPIQSLDAFSSSGGISLSHHSTSGSETSCVTRALAVHAEASSILPAVGQGEDSAATSDGSATSCEAKTCPACSATFPSSVALVRHTLSHRPMQFFQCAACENIFTSRGSFTEHLSQCPSQEGCYSCSACSKPFSTLKGLRAHERRYHFQTPGAADGNAFTCPECEQVFGTQTAYVNHLITHAVQQNHSDPKSLQCQVCSSSFYTRQALQKHMNSHKTDSPSIPVSCPLCSETFANRRALVAHQKKHLYCPFCNRNFVSRAELDAHNRETHQNERPWTCSLCNASYKFRFDLTRHQLKHEGKKFYACSTCGRDFYASTDLRQHEASVHSVIPRTKPFMCGQCGKRFFTRGHLNTHRRSHSSLQPFQCPHCPVRCKTTKNLEIHIRRHTGELPIKCKVCFGD